MVSGKVMKAKTVRKFWSGVALAACGLAWHGHGQEKAEVERREEPPPEHYTQIKTRQGRIFHDCAVKRIEIDALVVQHREGIAKVSFFDLGEELQRAYDFDPVAALKKYKADRERMRELKWRQFWANAKHEAEQVEQAEREKFLEEVKATWTPVEAAVLQTSAQGAWVRAQRICFVPSRSVSKLGFERNGPLRKTLVPWRPDVIFIAAPGISGDRWRGYLEPAASGTRPHPLRKDDRVPSYRAVALSDSQ